MKASSLDRAANSITLDSKLPKLGKAESDAALQALVSGNLKNLSMAQVNDRIARIQNSSFVDLYDRIEDQGISLSKDLPLKTSRMEPNRLLDELD